LEYKQWGSQSTPTTVFYPVAFPNNVYILVASDVGAGNSAIGCQTSGLNAFIPTATRGDGVGFRWVAIGK